MTVEHGEGVSLLSVRCDALVGPRGDQPTTELLADLCAVFDPDLVTVCREGLDVRTVSRLRRTFDGPVVDPGGGSTVRSETIDDVTIGVASRLEGIDALAPDADYVVCDDIETIADEVTLTVTLTGRETIARYRARSATAGREPTFLTGSLPASYDHVWTGSVDGQDRWLPVRGLAPIRRSGAPELACLQCGPDGRVAVSSVPADRFGLRAIEGVGATMASRLRDAGYDSRRAVADASPAALRSVRGVGAVTAASIRASARALADGCVVRRTTETLPPGDRDPLFVDIETDGLSPTVIWLIGVYDSRTDRYVDFVDTEPSRADPGVATRAFLEWLAAEYDRPALVTWNGYEFDFKHLDRFVGRYAPAYAEYWEENVATYDSYDWAVRQDNAWLPGRTNRLDDVAAAIGCERDGPAATLDGATLARRIRRSLASPEPIDIDWEAARAYCEADVRELSAVHDAIGAAQPAIEDSEDTESGDAGRQAGLGDF